MFSWIVFAALPVLAYSWEPGCGKSKFDDAGGFNRLRIVGGQESRPNEFPWQVFMKSDFGRYYCGAIIISSNWVMTAAHCTYGDTPSIVNLVVGKHSRTSEDGTEVTYRVSVIRQHPGVSYSAFTIDNDISLMQTTIPIALNENVAAVCAPNDEETYAGRTAVVSGWGQLGESAPCCPDKLQYVQVPVFSNQECLLDYPGNITERMICAGGREYADACHIDAGGPLVVKEGDIFHVIGIVSWAVSCGSGRAGIYTRVSAHSDWIGNI